MQLYKTFKAATESCKIRDLWITDFVLMTNVNKVAIAYTSKELSKNFFYLLKCLIMLLLKLFLKQHQNLN
jgi:hypothetical protein